MAITKKLREERDTLAMQEGNLRWKWGDWAVKVAGPPGEDHVKDGSQAKLAEAREDGVDGGDLATIRETVPPVDDLRKYREAAAAIPDDLRPSVRSIEAGRILGAKVKDDQERRDLIGKLANAKGVVTIDAIREWDGLVGTHGKPPEPTPIRRAKSKRAKSAAEKEAEDRIKANRASAKAAAANGQTLSAHVWRIVTKLDEWRRDLAVIKDELVTLSGEERERVSRTYHALRDELNASIAILDGVPEDEFADDVLEGTAVEVGGKLLST